MKLIQIFFFILLCFTTSCEIKGVYSGYKQLTKNEKTLICNYNAKYSDTCKYIRITGLQLQEELIKNSKSLVFIWVPHCKGKWCLSLDYYKKYAIQHDCKLYIVADAYEMKEIQLNSTAISRIYFINTDYYNSNYRLKYRKAFVRELTSGSFIADSVLYANHFYFSGNALNNATFSPLQ